MIPTAGAALHESLWNWSHLSFHGSEWKKKPDTHTENAVPYIRTLLAGPIFYEVSLILLIIF